MAGKYDRGWRLLRVRIVILFTECALEGDGEAERDARELDGEPRAAHDVEVG